MSHVMLAAEILQKAETQLRDVVAKAAAKGDYVAVVQVASWAKTVRDLLEKKPPARESETAAALAGSTKNDVAPVKNGHSSHRKHTDAYPRFFRKGDELVRVAWSRRARSEYQHKTTESVLKSVADTLSRLGKKGRIFSTDEVLPLRDPQGSEVPSYQAYVCIALMKTTGLIQQHGRQGYTIAASDEFNDAVAAIWKKLPSSE